jgi:tetratricopeptide (TPR) repeat protein
MPHIGISLVLEIENEEVARYSLGNLAPPPMENRQDIIVTGDQITQFLKRRNEVLNILNSYQRTPENQKLFEKARDAGKEKKTDQAIKLFRQLTESDKQDFVAFTELGTLYFAGNKDKDAATALGRAVELKPDFVPALLSLGKVQIAQKQFDAAIDILSKAVILKPDSADVNQYLGEAYLQSKKGSKAVIYLNKAIELAPIEKADIHLRLASLYNGANLKDRAAAEYKLLLAKVPNHPEKAMMEKYIKDNPTK